MIYIYRNIIWLIYSYPSHEICQKSTLEFVKVRSRDIINYFHLQHVDTSNCMYSIIRSSRHPRQDEKSVSQHCMAFLTNPRKRV